MFNWIFILVSIFILQLGCQFEKTSVVEPTRWLGPLGNRSYPDTGLLTEWPAEGPRIVWSYDSLGIGFSSAVIQNDYLYTTGMMDSTGYLYKIDQHGELVYAVPYGLEWTGSYRGTRGSPTVVGDKVYLVSGRGELFCFSNPEGEILWSKAYFTDFDGKNIMWGINETPVVDGDIIYATPGGKKYNVVALDRHTGELIWTCAGKGSLSAYCTPLLVNHHGRKLLMTYTADDFLGIDAATGELLWSVDVHWEWSVHSNTPLYHQGEILFPTGREMGGGKLKLSDSGDSVSVVWENQGNDYCWTAVLIDGQVYGSHTESKEYTWRCVAWETGEEKFTSRDLDSGLAVSADGLIYIYTNNGELALVKPDPEKFHIVSRAKITRGSGLHMSQPVFHNGVLYIRHGKSMIAYDVKQSTSDLIEVISSK